MRQRTRVRDANRGPHDGHAKDLEALRDPMGRSKVTVRAWRFGLAVLPARIQASAHDDRSASLSVLVHHSCRVRAESGSAKPRRSSSCENVRTTMSAYRFER